MSKSAKVVLGQLDPIGSCRKSAATAAQPAMPIGHEWDVLE